MPLVRAGLERLLLLLFGAARGIFLFQGVAFGGAWLAVRAAGPADAPAWLRELMLCLLLLSAIFFVAGFLLVAVRRWHLPDASGGSEPAGPWPVLLGLSLLALSALAARAGSGLPPLWSEIAARLDAVGFWEGLRQPGPSGLVTIPILLALLVPALVTAAACCQLALPLALLPLLAARSRLFPTLLALGAVGQAALVLGGWLATDSFGRLAEQASAAMAAAEEAELQRVAEQLQHATGVLASAAIALVAPLLGMLAWLAFLRLSGTAAAFFAEGASPAAHAAPRPARPESVLPSRPAIAANERPAAASRADASAAPAARAPARFAPLALAILGACMLLFGAADGLRARASYVSSQPAAGATLADAPATVRVSFGAALDPASSLSITRLVLPPHTGEQPTEIASSRRLAPDDPQRRTLEAIPSQLSAGVYLVRWQALPAAGGVPRFGSFCFGVGVPVPTDTTERSYSLQDRDAGARGRRHTFAGGALLLALGVLLPRLVPRR